MTPPPPNQMHVYLRHILQKLCTKCSIKDKSAYSPGNLSDLLLLLHPVAMEGAAAALADSRHGWTDEATKLLSFVF